MTYRRKSHCKRGHRMTERNSRWRVIGKYTVRGCRRCQSERECLKYHLNKLTVNQ